MRPVTAPGAKSAIAGMWFGADPASTGCGVAALAVVGASASVASATKPDPSHEVTICHATASSSNPCVDNGCSVPAPEVTTTTQQIITS